MTQREMNKLVKKFNESMKAHKHKLQIEKADVVGLRIDFLERHERMLRRKVRQRRLGMLQKSLILILQL